MQRQDTKKNRNRVAGSLSLICGLATIALLVVAGCSRPQSPVKSSPKVNIAAMGTAEFVGNDACADCHKAEFESHKASRHAHTLRSMTKRELGDLAPPEGQIPETKMALVKEDDRFVCVRIGYEDKRLPLSFVLGSGKTGMTYVGLLDNTTLFETRMSYFPATHAWHLTPGQGQMKPGAPGSLAQGEEARQCLNCHVVTLPKTNLNAEPRFFGVGCESCHGAGSKHVAEMKAGQPLTTMERIKDWKASRVNEMCAKCHRGPKEVKDAAVTEGMTARFQPFGLMKSQCFQKSDDTLSCNTCHNPHTNAETKTEVYEKACLNCHASGGTSPQNSTVTFAHKSCPVSPQKDCIGCHMPTRSVFPGQNIPTQMRDHRIAIYKTR